MKEITRMAIVSLAKTDESIKPEDLRAGLKALAGETPEPSGFDQIRALAFSAPYRAIRIGIHDNRLSVNSGGCR